jgi:transposase InsO family protein
VCGVLDRLLWLFALPESLRVDNGPEFISMALEPWADKHGVKLDVIQTRKPTQNAHIESFNGRVRRFRDEYPAQQRFAPLARAVPRSRCAGSTTTPCGHTARSFTARQRCSATWRAEAPSRRRGLPPPWSGPI